MRQIQRASSSRNVRFDASSQKIRVGRAQQNATGVQAEEGESVRIKVLDHLGGGKLIVDIKGQRVVANTNLWLEKGQEIDVIVKNIGEKIIMQIMSDVQQNISIAQGTDVKAPLGDIMQQLMESLEIAEAETELDGALRGILQNVKGLLQQIPVDVMADDLPEKIQNAVEALEYDYEHKLALALESDHFSIEKVVLQLKAQLMQIQSDFSDRPLQTALLENIDYLLENIEFQQLASISHGDDDILRLYFQLPFILHDQMSTAEVEFFRPKVDTDHDDNRFGIILNFDLEQLGHIEFSINIIHKYINCQIRTDEYETYTLAREYAEELEKRFRSIGYDVGAIHCSLDDLEANSGQFKRMPLDQKTAIDNIDITI